MSHAGSIALRANLTYSLEGRPLTPRWEKTGHGIFIKILGDKVAQKCVLLRGEARARARPSCPPSLPTLAAHPRAPATSTARSPLSACPHPAYERESRSPAPCPRVPGARPTTPHRAAPRRLADSFGDDSFPAPKGHLHLGIRMPPLRPDSGAFNGRLLLTHVVAL